MAPRKKKKCFYCEALISGTGEKDHFPIPESSGGTITVPCCISCHDMKDRFAFDEWPDEWIHRASLDFPKINREAKLFIARIARDYYWIKDQLSNNDEKKMEFQKKWSHELSEIYKKLDITKIALQKIASCKSVIEGDVVDIAQKALKEIEQ